MSQRRTLLAAVLALSLLALACAPQVLRGGEGTANPDLDRPALSVTLDRDDITYLVADYLERSHDVRDYGEYLRMSRKIRML